MLNHLFKLIWNKKKQNALLITEMFISFIVMFAIFTMMVYSYHNYKKPMNFEYENVWVVNFSPPENITNNDSVATFHDALKNTLRGMPQITAMSFASNNIPFSMSTANSMFNYENHKGVMSNIYTAEEDYTKVLNLKMTSGRWFTKSDAASLTPVVVITKKFQDELFEGKNPLGKIIGGDGSQMKVIGVLEDLKDKGTYHAIENGIYKPFDSSSARWAGTMLLKVREGTDATFESKLFKTLSNAIGTSIEIEHLDKKLESKNKIMLIPMIIASIVAGFLIINVALGLFGVLWYNINQRKAEIGLRRAVGASGSSVSRQLVSESLVLTTLSLIIGLFFAVQFPLLNVFDLSASIYITAIVMAMFFIYLLVFICSVYPGKQAAAIYPATALHED